MSSFIYFLRESLPGFRRNLSTAIGSIITIFLSLLIIGTFLVGGLIIQNIVNSVESEVSITAYVSDDAQQVDVVKLQTVIQGYSDVKEASYTSKEEALEKFRNSMSQSPEIIEQMDGENPLPASIDVELKTPQSVENVAKSIETDDLFIKICDNPSNPADSLKYGQKTVEKLFAVTNSIRIVGITLVALLIFIAMIFINNTIRLAILARRKEIAIMRLVGASNNFIRGPFLFEGTIHALIGSLLAIVMLELLRSFGLPAVVNTLTWIPLNLSLGVFLIIYAILIVAGVVIGLIGSALAMRRYLNV